MRPNLASPGLLEQPGSSGCGVRLLARVHQRVRRVDLPTPSITCRKLCRHRRRRPCNLVRRPWQPSARACQLRASWRLQCPTARARQLQASWRRLRPTTRAWQLRGSWLRPTDLSWQLGASWRRPCSLLSARGWRASKLRHCELVRRVQTLQPVELSTQVVKAGLECSGLVP
jgi:hypothetical protein